MRPPGIVVGVWRISELVAKDETLEVYSAIHLSLPLAAAVKILVGDGEARRKRFELEERFIRGSESGAFARYLGSGEFDGYPYLVTEFLRPMELPRKDKDIERFIIAVALGVREMHQKGYAHGRLTPEVIMARANGDPVIVELGNLTAKPCDDIRALGELIRQCYFGFPPYCWARVVKRATSALQSERYSSVGDFIYGVRTRTYFIRTAIAVLSFLAIGVAVVGAILLVIRH